MMDGHDTPPQTLWGKLVSRFRNHPVGVAVLSILALGASLSQLLPLVSQFAPSAIITYNIADTTESLDGVDAIRVGGYVVYPVGARTLLTLEHNNKGDSPITINRITVHVEHDLGDPSLAYTLDTDNVVGQGSQTPREYTIGLKPDGKSFGITKPARDAANTKVALRNLATYKGAEYLVLSPGDGKPELLRLNFKAVEPGRYRITISIGYSSAGESIDISVPGSVVIYKQPDV